MSELDSLDYLQKVNLDEGNWSLPDIIRLSDRSAIIGYHGNENVEISITHMGLRSFVNRLRIQDIGIVPGVRTALIMQNGPIFGVCLVALLSRCICVPIDITRSKTEIIDTINHLKVKNAIFPYSWKNSEVATEIRNTGLVALYFVVIPEDMNLNQIDIIEDPDVFNLQRRAEFNSGSWGLNVPSDKALILNTSGTSGKKKIILYTLEKLVLGSKCVASSWALKETDVNLNMMPLYHIGGIVRNLLAPIISGGATILCSGFDPILFWNIYTERSPTWYYAVPSMHMAILEEGRRNSLSSDYQPLRMICNAGGGLQHSLAKELLERFPNVSVLPSYGMSECMPISTPPVGYKLERPGTSGRSVGKEIEIAIFSFDQVRLPPNKIGDICVKGKYVFDGYEDDPEETEKAFNKEGFFNTQDVGYLDEEGYLFIIGRVKEIINRGGEIVSPIDVENALIKSPAVKEALAFSVPHRALQEVVGAILVINPGHLRPNVAKMCKFLAGFLHPTHWPCVLIFMDELPRNTNNKLMRIKLAERLGLNTLNGDESPESVSLLYEANCPSRTSTIHDKIICWRIKSDVCLLVEEAIKHKDVEDAFPLMEDEKDACACLFLVPVNKECDLELLSAEVKNHLETRLNSYDVPPRVISIKDPKRDANGNFDAAELSEIFKERIRAEMEALSPVERIVMDSLAESLGIKKSHLNKDSDFFELGGDSLKVGRLLYLIRRNFNLNVLALTIYTNRTTKKIADYIKSCLTLSEDSIFSGTTFVHSTSDKNPKKESISSSNTNVEYYEKTDNRFVTGNNEIFNPKYNNVKNLPENGIEIKKQVPVDDINFGGIKQNKFKENMKQGFMHNQIPGNPASLIPLIVGIIPELIIRPTRIMLSWFMFVYILAVLRPISSLTRTEIEVIGSSPVLVGALLVSLLFGIIVAPMISIILKHIIIWNYKPGEWRLFKQYYLRWWLLDQIICINGMGIFRYSNSLRIFFYRAMGAKIGKGVYIDPSAVLGEYDLITIGDNTQICSEVWMRPFSMRTGNMITYPINIGPNCIINSKCTIAPGSKILANTIMPHTTSSHEVDPEKPSPDKFKSYSHTQVPKPKLMLRWFLGVPIILICHGISYIPWLVVVNSIWKNAVNNINVNTKDSLQIIYYFSEPMRIVLHIVALCAKHVVCPVIYGIMSILVKNIVIGKVSEGYYANSEWKKFQRWLSFSMFTCYTFNEFYVLMGSHFIGTTLIYRALGSKVGKGIFWPGKPLSIFEFDLVEFGNNLVFGSRSQISCSTSTEFKRVRFGDGSMIADRCMVLPGLDLKRGCILGSGTVSNISNDHKEGSTWVGCNCTGEPVLWDNGLNYDPNQDTSTPFSRAIYGKKHITIFTRYILNLFGSILSKAISVVLWSLPLTVSLVVARQYLTIVAHDLMDEKRTTQVEIITFALIFACLGVVTLAVVIISLLMDIVSKKLLIGKRVTGNFDWDKDSYCERWKIYLMICRIRSAALDYIRGTHYLVIFFRLLGSKIGKRTCLYPLGGDPIMTEPDLVTIGDYAAVDRASIVSHVNSRGRFSLNHLFIGKGAVLCANSRIISGSEVHDYALVLEHTLLVGGDIAEAYGIFQGWPSNKVESNKPNYKSHNNNFESGEHRIAVSENLNKK